MMQMKKPVSILLSVIMVIGLFTIVPFTANAAEAVEYVYRWWDAAAKEVKQETRVCTDYTEMSERSSDELESGWYAASGNLFIDSRLFVRNGKTVNLILKDGATLNVHRGIGVESGATLNIYGQSQGTGTFEVVFDPGDDRNCDNAMIGGTGEDGSSGTISIHGGVLRLDSEGPRGAGIGGGSKGSPYIISIYGGDISVSAFGAGAGIGGGYKASASSYNGEGIRIYGGTITAESYTGAGIGNGYDEDSSYGSVAIYGGSVNARSLGGGAGIGGGMMGANGKIYIYGGDITAEAENDGGQSGAGIGSGANRPLINFEDDRDINISGGAVAAISQTGAGIGAGYRRNAGRINITGGAVFACSVGGGAGIGGGFGKSGGEINIQDAIVLGYSTGNVDKSLFHTVTSNMVSAAQNAIHTFGSSLDGSALSAITGAFSSLGALFNSSSGRGYGAGIGGGDKGKSGTINIKNSIIIARGGDLAPGIGCGKQSRYGNITIEESYVDTVGGNNGAGIGGGNEAGPADNTKISIIGSTVKATGGSESAGIGSGNEYPNYGTIEIDSSTVEAHGGAYAAGIGGGDGGSGSGSITIRNGSDVKAYAGEDAAGIGGGEGGNGGNIEIEDSTVYAQGNYYGAGIGGGENGGAGTITIRGESTVTGVGGDNGSTRGIGHGAYDSFVSFFTGDYPSNGRMFFSETFLVRIGEDKDHTRVVPATYIYENGRGDETRYISIYPCTHENLEDYVSDHWHGQKCTYCGKRITAEDHIWGPDQKCTVCGASALTFTYSFKEQNDDGDEVTRSISIPQLSSFTMPDPENVPDGMGFVGWKGDATIRYAGDVIDTVKGNNTYTAVYESVIETTYIDENGEQQTVLARKFPVTNDRLDLYRGWYIIDEDIPDDIGNAVYLHGDVKLILADDVTVSSQFLCFWASGMTGEYSSLSVYGQAKQTGTIHPSITQDLGQFQDFAQYGGRIINSRGLSAENCKIAGGVFEAYILEVSDKIELGWSGWSDYIHVNNYSYNNTDPEISVMEGKKLMLENGNTVLNAGVLSKDQKRNIRNQKLIPNVNFKFNPTPVWDWSADHTKATATFSNASGVKAEVRANVEHSIDGLYLVSTATVNFMGTLYSDTQQTQFRWYVINQTNATSGHGTVAFSADMAEPGELVEITATPDPGFRVSAVTVTPSLNNTEVEVLGNGNAFIMPQCNATVEVVFEQEAPNPITINTTGSGSVTSSAYEARVDDEITLNITPGEGAHLSDIRVMSATDSDAAKVNLTALSGEFDGNEGYDKLLDGNTGTKWCVGVTQPRHIIMKADAKVCMTGYSLTTGNDNASPRYGGRNWKDYTIYGANFASDSEAVRNSAQWQVVKAVENDSVTQDVNFTKYDYPLDAPAAPYQYYKIEITSNKGGSSIQMSEFEMQAVAAQEIALSGEGDTRTFTMPAYPVSVTAAFSDNFGTHLAGHSISLDGDIAVNFYMNLDPEITSHEGLKMQFSVPDTSTEYQHQEIEVSDNIKVGNYYVFKCRVAAKNMDSVISAQLVDNENNKSVVYTYSVMEYADYLLEHVNANGTMEQKAYAKAAPLVRAMLNYGAYAQNYFGTDAALSDIETAIPEKTYTVTGIEETLFDGATLSLKSQTTLSLYFKSATPITLSMDSKTEGFDYELAHKGKEYIIRIRNISATELNDDFTVTVTSNGQSGTVTYSPMTYCYRAQNSGDAKLRNTAKALYRYWLEADKYFNQGGN